MTIENNKLLRIAEESAIAGGRHVKEKYFEDSGLAIREKTKNDFVTNLDVESEKIIRKIIKKELPNTKIIGEEEGEEDGGDGEIEWYVDPLDGTGAFIRGNLAFVSVSVSAVKRENKEILAGAVYNPFTEVLYSAMVTTKKIKAKSTASLKKARILLDISEDHPFNIREALTPDNNDFGRILRYDGSFAQHMCLLAKGTLDGGVFWGIGKKGNFWDLAASLLICQESGLIVTNLLGEEINFNDTYHDQLIVAPESLHKELLEWVSKVRAELMIDLNKKPSQPTKESQTTKKTKVTKKRKATKKKKKTSNKK